MSVNGRTATEVFLITLLAVTALGRNEVLRTPLSAWTDAAEKSPGSSRVRNNLGQAYASSGRFEEAAREYRRALALRRYNIDAYYNLASSYEALGRMDLTIPYYEFYCAYETSESPVAVRDRQKSCDRVAAAREAAPR